MDAVTGLAQIRAMQAALSALAVFHLTAHRFPPSAQLEDNLEFDYVVIGGGTTGSIVASRLTEDPDCTVAVIERGGDPPLESLLAGQFPIQPLLSYDYNYQFVDDHYTSQRIAIPGMTAGKLLGGTSAMSHTFHLRGNPHDFDRWAIAAGDDSWAYKGMLPYFIKSEAVDDADILNGPTSNLHGTKGNIGLTRQIDSTNDKYIEALKEMGYDYIPDINGENNLGVGYPYHLIAKEIRQDGAESYLSPAKNRKNLYVFKHTTATEILFDGNNAVGVQVEEESGIVSKLLSYLQFPKKTTIKAKKEVILAAGVVKTPQLLMLSGIGPADHLNSLNIPVRSDVPVGKNFRDRTGLVLAYQMEPSLAPPPPMDPARFPVHVTFAYKALNQSQSYPDFQAINLIFPHDSQGTLQILLNLFKYENKIVDQIYNKNKGHTLLLVGVSIGNPLSTGEILLKSRDPYETPSIRLGLLNNPKDLEGFAEFLLGYSKIEKTAAFKNVGATYVDLDLEECRNIPRDTLEYWKCYTVGMSGTFWQYIGSCAMGSVVDSKLRVKGVERLRVVDASAIPNHNSGEILAAVIAFAEKAADLIKEDSGRFQQQSNNIAPNSLFSSV